MAPDTLRSLICVIIVPGAAARCCCQVLLHMHVEVYHVCCCYYGVMQHPLCMMMSGPDEVWEMCTPHGS